jgi:hypothetical protein
VLGLRDPVRAAARGADDAKKEGEKSDKPSQEQLIKDLEKMLTGAKLVGQFTVTGGAERPPAKEEYTITSAQKIPDGDLWLLKANIKYGKTDQTFPIPLEIKWAGDTPVITLDKVLVPGLGTFTSRVVVHRDWYAGTWSGVIAPAVADEASQESRRSEADSGPRTTSNVQHKQRKNQAAAAALARSLAFHSARKSFISALTLTIRGPTPLYFLMTPVTVLVTAPWLTRLCSFS